jgi:G3E family GTPase
LSAAAGPSADGPHAVGLPAAGRAKVFATPLRPTHVQEAGIASVSLTSTQPMDSDAVSGWLERLVAEQGADILRAKGIIDIAGEPRRMVFQAVHMLLEGELSRAWEPATRSAIEPARLHRPAARRRGSCRGF